MKVKDTITTADVLVEELQARGVEHIATLNGFGLDPLYLACKKHGMRMIDVRNEQAASWMAEVTGRLTRSVGVCAVSAAVAHVNGLTGVANAYFDGAPMLLITGTTPLAREGLGDFQDFDPVPIAAPLCKYARKIDAPELVASMVNEAFAAATSGRPGPVHLALPTDIGAMPVDPDKMLRSREHSGVVRVGGAGDPVLVKQVAELLKQAKKPLVIAGSGVYYSRGESALAEFVGQQQIPTVIPIWDRGSVPKPIDEFVGVIGAATGGPRYLAEADLILSFGAGSDYRVGQYSQPVLAEGTAVVRIAADEMSLYQGVEADLSIQGSPAVVLEQLKEACQTAKCPPASDWLAEARSLRDAYRQECLDSADTLSPGTNARDVILAVGEVLTDDTVLLMDGGNISQWFHQLLLDRYSGDWITCGRSGVIGFGLPGAMAAKARYPDRPAILVSGDGSFTFTVAELECASRQGLPFVAVVADDEQWGISVSGHVSMHGEPLYSTLGPTRLDIVAEGFGCIGVRVESKDELVPALSKALAADRPTVIHVPIVPGSPMGRGRE